MLLSPLCRTPVLPTFQEPSGRCVYRVNTSILNRFLAYILPTEQNTKQNSLFLFRGPAQRTTKTFDEYSLNCVGGTVRFVYAILLLDDTNLLPD